MVLISASQSHLGDFYAPLEGVPRNNVSKKIFLLWPERGSNRDKVTLRDARLPTEINLFRHQTIPFGSTLAR